MRQIFFLFLLLYSHSLIFGQDVNVEELCQSYKLSTIDSKTHNDSLRAYLAVVNKSIYHLNEEKKDSVLQLLYSACPELKNVSTSYKPFRLENIQPSASFENSKATIKWTKKERKSAIKDCSNNGVNKKNCSTGINEIATHINFKDYQELTDYQKGRLMSRVLSKSER